MNPKNGSANCEEHTKQTFPPLKCAQCTDTLPNIFYVSQVSMDQFSDNSRKKIKNDKNKN